MRDLYRNPMLYYLVAPIVVAIWPLMVWLVYLPKAQHDMENDRALYLEGQTYILDILKYDPERLKFTASDGMVGEFSYAKEIDRVANRCGIQSNNCSYGAGTPIPNKGKTTQNARVTLKDVGIVQTATFLSTIQSMWVNLKCDKVELTKKEGLPDKWEVDLTFWYTY